MSSWNFTVFHIVHFLSYTLLVQQMHHLHKVLPPYEYVILCLNGGFIGLIKCRSSWNVQEQLYHYLQHAVEQKTSKFWREDVISKVHVLLEDTQILGSII